MWLEINLPVKGFVVEFQMNVRHRPLLIAPKRQRVYFEKKSVPLQKTASKLRDDAAQRNL